MWELDVPTRPAGRRRGLDVALAAALGLAATLAVAVTIRDVGLTWDEPTYFNSQKHMRTWFHRLLHPAEAADRPGATWQTRLDQHWRYEVAENRHPPMAGYLSNLAWLAFHRWMDEAWAYRMSSAILFGFLVVLLYWEARRAWGRLGGAGAAGALVLMPRVFGHAHIAATDTPSMVMWFLSWFAFRRVVAAGSGRAPIGRCLVFGVVLGLSLLTKFTNWTVVVPLVLWTVLFQDRVWWNRPRLPALLMVALLLAAAVAVGLNPGWWARPGPLYRVERFLSQSLGRGSTFHIPTYFLGGTYAFALPWYNAPLLTAATTPVAILALFAIGLAATFRDRLRNDLGAFVVMTVLFFWVIRALPITPGHDGIRLFLPAFPFVAALAGGGLAAVARASRRPRAVGSAVLAVMLVSAGYQLVRIHPYHLSYYSEVVGGPAGAHRLGFETTYWWDAATEEFLDLLNEKLPPNAQVFGVPGWPTLAYWQERGRLRPDIHFVDKSSEYGRIEFLILLCRQGKFDERFSPNRPPGYTAWELWHWYRTWDRQFLAFAPRHGVPLIVVVEHKPGTAADLIDTSPPGR